MSDRRPDFVFGYGSLIQSESRRRNLRDPSDPVPARLRGWRRGWITPGPEVGFTTTFLGVTPAPGASVNGVLARVEPTEWEELDRRERGYRRVVVEPSAVETLDAAGVALPSESVVAVYEGLRPTPPDAARPLIQSYIDICLRGCLEVDARLGTDDAFAREFVRSTDGWSVHWVNDRLFPRAPTRLIPEATRIDALLAELLPEEFASIRIE